MRVLIMAAGRASRFNNISKAFLEINGQAIIERLVGQLRDYGLGPIYIVVGHKAELFLQLKNVVLIPNPDYLSGDNAQGLRISLDTIGFDDTLILDADLILTDGALKPLLDSYYQYKEPVSLVDLSFVDEEAMKVVIENDHIVEYSKERGKGAEICTLVTTNVLKNIYVDLDKIRWWGVGVGEGRLRPRIAPLSTSDQWIEVDTPNDYQKAISIFES